MNPNIPLKTPISPLSIPPTNLKSLPPLNNDITAFRPNLAILAGAKKIAAAVRNLIIPNIPLKLTGFDMKSTRPPSPKSTSHPASLISQFPILAIPDISFFSFFWFSGLPIHLSNVKVSNVLKALPRNFAIPEKNPNALVTAVPTTSPAV